MDTAAALKNLCDARDILQALGITCWLTDGTLLGAVREGGFISYDKDMDLGVDALQYKPEIVECFQQAGFYLHGRYGIPDCGLVLAFKRNEIKVDLFFFYRSWDRTVWHAAWHCPTPGATPQMIQYVYPSFRLKYMRFLDETFLAPAEPEKYLTLKYGDWRTPVHKWDWKFDPKNHRKTEVSIPGQLCSLSSLATFIIKTFERPQCLTRCLETLFAQEPKALVIVVDDSRQLYNGPYAAHPQVTLMPMPFDSGLSAGRNLALQHLETPYFILMDDDFVITPHTRFSKLLFPVQHLGYDIAGGSLWQDRGVRFEAYCQCMKVVDKVLYDLPGYYQKDREFLVCDKVFNFFAASTRRIRDFGGWDARLKLVEHTDFFLRFKEWGGKVVWVPEVAAVHSQEKPADYLPFRKRGKLFIPLCEARGGFERVEHSWEATPAEVLASWNAQRLPEDVLRRTMDTTRPILASRT